ncbi:hypothetical protein MBLNU459_g6923t1 [Dothideomycetes sp. NU459]
MSVVGEIVGIVACVAAIVSAYNDGGNIVRKIREKRAERRAPPPTRMLEESLSRDARDIEAEQTLGVQRLGITFDRGDEIARRELKQITLVLKSELFDHLVLALRDDNITDFEPAMNVADRGRDQTISVLMQMRQRLQMVGPSAVRVQSPQYQPAREAVYPMSPWTVQTTAVGDQPTQQSAWGPAAAPAMYQEPTSIPKDPPARRRDSKEQDQDFSPSYFPKFKISFRRQSSEARKSIAASPPTPKMQQSSPPSWQEQQNRTMGSTLAEQQQHQSGPSSWQHGSPPSATRFYESDRSTAMSSVPESAPPVGRPFVYPDQEDPSLVWGNPSPGPHAEPPVTVPVYSVAKPDQHFSVARGPTYTLPVPTAQNDYLGFCKGAWRLQNGDSSAFKRRLEFNSGWSSSQVPYLACSSAKCVFAGRIPAEKLDKVWHSASRAISFRWRFLAKSHATQSKTTDERYVYLCMFCALTGDPPRAWDGVDTLLAHLATHRSHRLPGEVLHRARCVVGRVADDAEDFDINIRPLPDAAAHDEAAEEAAPSRDDSLFEADSNPWS